MRIDFELDELKEQIKEAGVLNPITVIPYKVDGKERYKLVDGERRYRATMLAIQEGAQIGYIKALKAPKDASTEQLYIEQMMRNEGKRFTEMECAIMFRRFKEELGYNQEQIAGKFKKSPAFVSKCLALLDLPKYLQDQIIAGTISTKAAREIASNYVGEHAQVKAAKKAIQQAQEQGKTTASNKEVNSHLKESKEAKALSQALKTIWAYMDGVNLVDIDLLAKLLDRTESISRATREYKKQTK